MCGMCGIQHDSLVCGQTDLIEEPLDVKQARHSLERLMQHVCSLGMSII